jgi:hypothetical protein
VDSPSKREKPKAAKMPEKRAAHPSSAAPWNDGGPSFSTKERSLLLAGKVMIFHVFQVPF